MPAPTRPLSAARSCVLLRPFGLPAVVAPSARYVSVLLTVIYLFEHWFVTSRFEADLKQIRTVSHERKEAEIRLVDEIWGGKYVG